jgi:MFS family permease
LDVHNNILGNTIKRMNVKTKRLALGGLNLVVGLLVGLLAIFMGLLSALPIGISGVNASGLPVTLSFQFTSLVFAATIVGFAAAFIVATVGWLTGRISDRRLAQASFIGIVLAALSVLTLTSWTWNPAVLLVSALIAGLLAVPLILNVWVVQRASRREEDSVIGDVSISNRPQ